MKRINWADLRTKIPHFVQIGKTRYEIVWIESFKDPNVVGETRFAEKQIALKTGQSDKDTVKTYLHEVTHAVSHEESVNLTENQVIRIEKSLIYLLKPNNVFLEK